MKTKLSSIGLLLCIFFISENSYTQTFISGNVSGTWTKEGNPYYIIDNASVNSGYTLNLEPGVLVIIGKDIELSIYGVINAVGSEEEPVIFKSPNDTVYWNRIITYSNGSMFKNCIFSEAKTGLYMYIGCVCSSTYRVEVFNCTFKNCSEYAIYGHSHGQMEWNGTGHPTLKPIISNCKFLNSRYGIYFYLQGSIHSTPYGPRKAQGSVNATITNNIFKNIHDGALKCKNQYGETSEIVFKNNNLINCFWGVFTESPYDIQIKNNIFSGHRIGIQRTGELSSDLTNNCFFNNDSVNFIGYPEAYGQVVMDNINNDPCDVALNMFLDPLFSDDIYYNLSNNSPCIDAGILDTTVHIPYDFGGKIRVWDGNGDGKRKIDIGALEYGAPICHYIEVTEFITICAGENYNEWTETGTYTQQLTSSNGCDSTVITNLTVIESHEINESISICKGENYEGWDVEGEYQRTLYSKEGCDSIIINTNLIIHELPNPDFTVNSDTITSVGNYSSYQWYSQYGAIEGATSNQYVIENSGTYYLGVINENGCTAMSEGMDLIKTGIDYLQKNQFNVIVVPNPNDGKFRLKFQNGEAREYQIKIINGLGQIIFEKDNYLHGSSQEEEFDLSQFFKGNYIIRITHGNAINTQKILIQ